MIPLTIQKDKALPEKMETSHTNTQYSRAALLLGNTFLYRVGFTTFMYLLNANNAIVNIEADAKICDVDPIT